MGVYDEPIEGWSGQIQSLVSDAYEDLEGEYGFLIEATGMFPGLISAIFPWSDGTTHKQLMQSFRWQAPFITVARDRGSGEVVLDDLGRAVMRWGLGDEVDRRLAQRANVELCRLHQAAGAVEIFTAHASELRWRPGEDFEDVRLARGRGVLRPERRGLLHGAPDGLVPDGLGSFVVGGGRPRRAARREGRLDRRRQRLPDGAGREPDDLDHVAGASDGGGVLLEPWLTCRAKRSSLGPVLRSSTSEESEGGRQSVRRSLRSVS